MSDSVIVGKVKIPVLIVDVSHVAFDVLARSSSALHCEIVIVPHVVLHHKICGNVEY